MIFGADIRPDVCSDVLHLKLSNFCVRLCGAEQNANLRQKWNSFDSESVLFISVGRRWNIGLCSRVHLVCLSGLDQASVVLVQFGPDSSGEPMHVVLICSRSKCEVACFKFASLQKRK